MKELDDRGSSAAPGSAPGPPRVPIPVVELRGVGVVRGGRPILDGIDWAIHPGERWVVVGPNGAGKTTLASIVGTSLWPTRGEVAVLGARLGDVDARELRRRIGHVSAAVTEVIPPDLAVLDVVVSARDGALEPWWYEFGAADWDRGRDLLARLGCRGLERRAFGTLSSGERQRVAVARGLMSEPDLLLLDEPAAGLDLGAREALTARLADLAASASPAAIVLVTHHVEEIPEGFGHALVLAGGRLLASGPIDEVLVNHVLSRAYGLPLGIERRGGRFTAWAR